MVVVSLISVPVAFGKSSLFSEIPVPYVIHVFREGLWAIGAFGEEIISVAIGEGVVE